MHFTWQGRRNKIRDTRGILVLRTQMLGGVFHFFSCHALLLVNVPLDMAWFGIPRLRGEMGNFC